MPKKVTLQKPGAAGTGVLQPWHGVSWDGSPAKALIWGVLCGGCPALLLSVEVPVEPTGCRSPSGDGRPADCPDSLVGGAGWQIDG